MIWFKLPNFPLQPLYSHFQPLEFCKNGGSLHSFLNNRFRDSKVRLQNSKRDIIHERIDKTLIYIQMLQICQVYVNSFVSSRDSYRNSKGILPHSISFASFGDSADCSYRLPAVFFIVFIRRPRQRSPSCDQHAFPESQEIKREPDRESSTL